MRTGTLATRVGKNGHYFEYADGAPYFVLADTSWMLFGKLREEEIRRYFEDRSAKGFTTVQACVFRDLFEPNTPNAYGVRPFASDEDLHAARLNQDWIDYVLRMTKVAAEYGLVMALLPTWGDKWHPHSNSAGPVIMDRESGKRYCRTLSDAFGSCDNVIWVLGGDSPIRTTEHTAIIRSMAEGLREGKSGDRLITFYPPGIQSSAIFHSEEWLDFNVMQTGHHKLNTAGYLHIERYFNEPPFKPCFDMEANYEYMPMFSIGEKTSSGDLRTDSRPFAAAFSAYDVRKSLYRTVMAGAAGFSYGCEPIRQVHRKGDRVHVWADVDLPTWDEGLAAPGSSQVGFLVELLKARSYNTRVPAQELFVPYREAGAWADHLAIAMDTANQLNSDPAARISIARCTKGSYIMAYLPVRQMLTLDTSGIDSDRLQISIYDPENRMLQYEYEAENNGSVLIVPERDLDSFVVIEPE